MNSNKFKKLILAGLLITAFQLPAISAKKNEEFIQMPKTYPAKYTSKYIKQITPIYKPTGKEEIIYVALDMLKGTNGEFSRNAILGNNLSGRPVKIEFRDLGTINPDYAELGATRLFVSYDEASNSYKFQLADQDGVVSGDESLTTWYLSLGNSTVSGLETLYEELISSF